MSGEIWVRIIREGGREGGREEGRGREGERREGGREKKGGKEGEGEFLYVYGLLLLFCVTIIFSTILSLSILYSIGNVLMAVSAIPFGSGRVINK